jgi:hypothetical protein
MYYVSTWPYGCSHARLHPTILQTDLFFLSLTTLDHAIQATPSYTLPSISFILYYLIAFNGITLEGHHTKAVQLGPRYGSILFIVSEVMFLFAFKFRLVITYLVLVT